MAFKPEPIDLSHHLSDLAKARATSPLKGLQKYWGKPGIISLAGGLPSPAYFPFTSISADVLVSNSFPLAPPQESSSFSWLWKLLGGNKEKTTSVSVPKYSVKPGDINLATALQYGLQTIVAEFTEKVFQPGFKDAKVLLHAGNTDGWSKIVMTLCNPGEGVLVSKWTYPSAMATMRPFGIKAVPVDIDGQGVRSDALRTVLSEWDETVRGMPRPHVIYAVPIGENPTGTTTEAARKKEIYQICVEYDIIIVEDDPYYFLQEGQYVPKAQRAQTSSSGSDAEAFLASLAPSYLKFDYQGRVVRLDTFSKTIAPGCRLGWFTCNALFAERLERQSETSTQVPSGFAQSLVASALLEWRYEGYIRWLQALRLQYTLRRDFFVDCLAEEFQLQVARGVGIWEGCDVFSGCVKPSRSITGYFNEKFSTSPALFSFVPPTSGMFVWIKVHFDQHPSLATLGEESLEMQLWAEFAEAGLLIGPGVFFDPTGHFRISFSNSDVCFHLSSFAYGADLSQNDEMKKATQIFGTVIKKFMATL
ncbi:pyridoxal phosphate-dependent transferase [Mycena rebaudengoi]|nr:pyridoxal phosphate-dependent transferase [Mycena rebaudengoi]